MSNSQGVTLKKHKETGQSGAILGKHKKSWIVSAQH